MTQTTSGGVLAGDNIGRGIVLALVSIVTFGIQDAVAKILVQDYSPFQIVMVRYWAFGAFSLYLAARQAPLRQALRSNAPMLQVLRGMLLIGDIWLFAIAIKTVPLAELQAISLVYPLLVTLFAIPLLGEKVGIFRIGAVIAGFLGAMVIVRPGGLPIDTGVIFAVAASSMYALYVVITRKVAKQDSTATNMVYVGVIGLVLSTIAGVFYWQPIAPKDFLFVAVVMVTTCLGHGLMMKALSMAPASVLQTFSYLSLPWAITLSFVVFGHLIDPISLIGAAVIVAAGLVVIARERVKKIQAVMDAPLPGKE